MLFYTVLLASTHKSECQKADLVWSDHKRRQFISEMFEFSMQKVVIDRFVLEIVFVLCSASG